MDQKEYMEQSASPESEVALMLKMNALSYAPPMDSSVVNSRQIIKLNFSNTTVAVGSGGNNVDIVVNSGDYYVYGPTCALAFDIVTDTAGAFNSSTGAAASLDGLSAFNCIQTYTHLHRSGDQLDVVDEVGALAQVILNYKEDDSMKNYQGMMGSGIPDLATAATRVVLPLSVVSGLFAQRALIPAQLLAGSRIQLQFASYGKAIKGAASGTYTITNLQLILDCYDLFDSAKKALQIQMANVKSQGVQFCYSSWFNINQTTTSTQLDFNFNYSAGRTILIAAKSRIGTTLSTVTADSIGSEPFKWSSFRWRLGSNYLPLDEVKNAAEAYFLTQNAFKNFHMDDLDYRCPLVCGVAYRDPASTATSYSGSTSNRVVIAVDLARNQIVSLSGSPTNNSRLLTLTASFPSDGATRYISQWLCHLRCANVMLDNVVVDK